MQRFSPAEKFWLYVVTNSQGCWDWIGPTDGDEGYGRLMANGFRTRAHQFSWALHFGPIPDGMDVLHRCDNPPCTRPDHLFLGTQADNNRDMHSKGRGRYVGKPPLVSRLSPEQVGEIRRLRANGMLLRELATMFSVRIETIQDIAARRTWKHI